MLLSQVVALPVVSSHRLQRDQVVFLMFQVLLDPVTAFQTPKRTISTHSRCSKRKESMVNPRSSLAHCHRRCCLPCGRAQYATPVKAKTSAPLPFPGTTCAALTWRGLVELTRTGSRGRGAGCGRRWRGERGDSRSASSVARGPLGRLR